MLLLNSISKSFGSLKVADNVTFDVPEGQALGIIGPNGAGKSSLFNLITGNLMVDAGSIAFDGCDVTRMPAMQRCLNGVGRSFQIPQPFGNLTVYENLAVAAIHGRDVSEADAVNVCVDVLERTGLILKANVLASSLSLLERKRLELARAIATGPKLLLLDEIAGGLTDLECKSLVQTIRDIHSEGVTIIWIEHVLHALTSVVDRLLVLDFGRIVGIGAPAEIMESKEVKEIYLGIEV